MKTLKEIQGILFQHKEDLLKRFNAVEIGVFGSYSRSEQKESSDVDILVEFNDTPDLLKFIELERTLEDMLQCRVDLVRKPAIRPEIKESVMSEVIFI